MQTPLTVLAVLGIGALLWQLLRTLLDLGRRGVEAFLADQSADVRARRGDLTGLAESEAQAHKARRGRWRSGLRLTLLLVLLLVPPLTGLSLEIYAACSALWLLGATRERTGPPAQPEERRKTEERPDS